MYFEAFSSPYSSNKTLTFYLINDALFVILLQELFSVFINSDWGIVVGKSLFSLDNILTVLMTDTCHSLSRKTNRYYRTIYYTFI